MLKVGEQIGRTLEEDYRLYYVDGKYGQKRLANRWGVKRQLIFGSLPGRRRNWVQMLGLPTKGKNITQPRLGPPQCELCSESDCPLERAHWIPASEKGGAGSNNIVRLCRNCHGKLDLVADEGTVERASNPAHSRGQEVS
jgi:5-methylcytosine-specific restriction endonuclease McrA